MSLTYLLNDARGQHHHGIENVKVYKDLCFYVGLDELD
jgi:hypothetical protein